MPLAQRMEIVRALRCVDEVVASIDQDETVAETLRLVKPDKFAKGGDRSPDKVPIPAKEVEVCNEIGCEIVYGVGEQLESSSELLGKYAGKIRKETIEEIKKVWGKEA